MLLANSWITTWFSVQQHRAANRLYLMLFWWHIIDTIQIKHKGYVFGRMVRNQDGSCTVTYKMPEQAPDHIKEEIEDIVVNMMDDEERAAP